MSTRDWKRIPSGAYQRWEERFGATQGGHAVPGSCPVCDKHELHRYYQVGRAAEYRAGGHFFVAFGKGWEWCSACYTYEHFLGLVPDWWDDDLLSSDDRVLDVIPDALEDAVRARQ